MNFLTEDFLLSNDVAKELYHSVAKHEPIFDYHCHLSPELIATNYQFENLYDIWLKGDHYKWRAMRANGVDEAYCTGSAKDYDKYLAYAKTVPYTIGNPLYHWTHLELRRPFGITDRVLNEKTAESIWNECNEMLHDKNFSTQGIIKQMNVKMIGTTDDPIDSLEHHKAFASKTHNFKMLPSFRPDKALNIHLDSFNEYMLRLGEVSDVEIKKYSDLTGALEKRIEYFAQHGCVVSDHALDKVVFAESSEIELDYILSKKIQNKMLTPYEIAQFKTAVLLFLGQCYAKRQWIQQYHIGALRNNNDRLLSILGPDTGFDSINDTAIAEPLSKLMNKLDKTDALPKTILYCLNPSDNEIVATMIGNFQGGGIPGKIQFGSGWWFNDQKDGMIRQLTQLSQMGLLSRFVGMLTDSRSFLSFTRHEYFRRILCQMIGQWVVDGEAPNDMELLGKMVSNICYHNANHYFLDQ